MGRIIPFEHRREAPPDNLITLRPWEFRKPARGGRHFIQKLRARPEGSGEHRHTPGDFFLKGSVACTIQCIYNYRYNEEKMREVYYLAGLIDCMINQVNPLLRTDLIKDIYNKILTLKKLLGANWYGPLDHVLLPVEDRDFDQRTYREALYRAGSMKECYRIIRAGTDEMFDILSARYLFYTPGRGE